MIDYKDLIDSIPSSFISLSNGTANRIYASDELLIRKKVINKVDEPFNLPVNEKNIYKSLKGNIHVPHLYYFDEYGNKVEQFIKGREFRKDNKEDLLKVSKAIKSLHALPLFDIQEDFDIVNRFLSYKGKREASFIKEKEVVKKGINIINSSKQVISHNDLWSGNILIDEEKAYLIDFEFGSINSYYFDLASLIEENALDKESLTFFLSNFNLEEKEIRDIYSLIPFLDILWYYWALSRYNETNKTSFLDIAKSKKEHYLANLDFFL